MLRRKLRRDIGRMRPQFIAVGITVMLGIALFAASFDSYRNLTASYDRTAVEYRFANLFVSGGDVQAFVSRADGDDGVTAAAIRTVADLPFDVASSRLLGRIVGMPPTGQPDVNRVEVLRGSGLDPADPSGVLVESHMADHFGLEPGTSFRALGVSGWQDLTVRGVVSSPEYIWPARSRQDLITSPDNFGVVFAADDTVRSLAGSGPNEAAVYYRGGEADAALTSSLESIARDTGATEVYTREEQPSNAALNEDLQGFAELSLFFPILFLAAAAMAAYVMINRLVHAQRPQVGILLAEGYDRKQILRHYLGYGLVPGLSGAVIGAAGGILLARVITGFYTRVISVPIRVLNFYPTTLIAALALGIGATALAAAFPAITASRLTPAAAMRSGAPSGRGKVSLLERIVPPVRRLPSRWRMTLRGIERNPRRTVYTMLGVILSLMLVMVSWGMLDTMRFFFDRQFLEVQRQDASVYFEQPVGTGQVTALESVSGVERAEPVLEAPVSLAAAAGGAGATPAATGAATGGTYDTTLVAMEQGTQMHGFYAPDGTAIDLPRRGLLVGVALRDLIGIEAGDGVTVTVPSLGATLDAVVAGFVEEPLGTYAYLSREYASELAGSVVPSSAALVAYRDGADAAAVKQAILDVPGVAAFQDANALYDTMQNYMGLFYVFVGIMLAFGGAMAFALMFNAMSVNVAERSREVATLQAVGMERSTISRLITSENLLVAAFGIPPGLVLGYYLSSSAMASFNSDLFSIPLHMQTATFVISAVAMLVVALISQLPGLRAVRRIDIARIVKERSV
jgi:putative ABC transport system permease protein